MGLQLLMLFNEFQMNLNANKIKYGYINAVNFIINQYNLGYKIIVQKCIPYIMKEKSVVAERFIRTLKTKIYKYVTSITKCIY